MAGRSASTRSSRKPLERTKRAAGMARAHQVKFGMVTF
jgi:hypothetical protein